jgi:hypothetical protein
MPQVVMIGQFPLAIGVVFGLVGSLVAYLLARQGKELLLDLLFGGFVGAKLLYFILDPLGYLKNPVMLLLFPYGTKALPAAMAGALLLGAWGLRKTPERLRTVDAATVPAGLGLAVAAIGWTGPGAWAFAPALGTAALFAFLAGRRPGLAPGLATAQTLVLIACALTLADVARPNQQLVAGISLFQLSAAVIGTLAWLWAGRIQPQTKDPGT